MKLNTVSKGNAFEDKVFSKMKELLDSDMLGLSAKYSKIFQKKSYIGKTGNKIIFDIAIESYHPDSDECSTLTLIECKDYNAPIQVEKLRDFASRIEDVGGNKGYFITTSHFQKGAIQHAKSCKIGLAKFNNQNLDIEKWILRRISYKNYQKEQTILEELYSHDCITQNNFVAVCEHHYYTNLLDFIAEQLFNTTFKITIDYLSDAKIKSIVFELIEKMQYPFNTPRSTDFLTAIISQELNLKLILDQPLPRGELGICNFTQRTINISPDLQYNSPRWRFTLAHEIGHFILHESICSNNNVCIIFDNETSLNSFISDSSLSRIEIQANKFAVHLLIPDELFKRHYATIHKQLGIPKFPYMYLDNQPCNRKDCLAMFLYLGEIFNISPEMVKIKLIDMKLLTINESIKQLKDFII